MHDDDVPTYIEEKLNIYVHTTQHNCMHIENKEEKLKQAKRRKIDAKTPMSSVHFDRIWLQTVECFVCKCV